MVEFRCPACSGEIVEAERLACTRCARQYPVTDGIIDFRVENRSYYFNPVPPDEMRALIRGMEHEGWARTVARFLKHVGRPADWLDNLTADGRYAWKLLLNLPPDSVLLDIGCGLGNLTYNLAPHVGKVYAMDLTWERAAFAKRRFALAGGREHVVVLAGGDGPYLPLPDQSVDCAVLSGVLEWVGEAGTGGLEGGTRLTRAIRMALSAFGARSPRAVQLRFLREIRRVLKPEGQLFVAIENRTSYRYFLGDPDHHSGLRYSSLLPRCLANLYSIWVTRRPYRTYTYSIPGYRRLLRQAGFGHKEFYELAPGYTHLREVLPLDVPQARWRPGAPRAGRERITRSKYLVQAYGIVAGSNGRSPRLLDDVLGAVEAGLCGRFGPGHVQIFEYRVSEKEKGFITAEYGAAPILIKLPFGAGARAGEAANARFLALANARFGRRLGYLPASLVHGSVHNVEYFVEERCKGIPLHVPMRKLGRTVLLPEVEAVLTDLNPGPRVECQAFAGEFFADQVQRHLQALSEALDDAALLEALTRFFRERLYGANLPRGIQHGDFGFDNILVEGGRVSGLIDWESAAEDGIPLLDAFAYLEGVERRFGGGLSLRDTIPALARGEWPDAAEREFLDRQYKRLGVDRAHHEALVYLYWLQHVCSQLPYGLAYSVPRMERNVVGVARQLLGRA